MPIVLANASASDASAPRSISSSIGSRSTLLEPGGLQDGADPFGVGERERCRRVGWRHGQFTPDSQCAAQRHQPVVLLKRPPGEQRERAASAQSAADVRERGDRIAEEHAPEAAHRNVEFFGFEREDLGVAADERHVVEAFVGAPLAGQLEHPGRQVDPCDLAVGGDAGDVARRSAGAAAHVQHAICAADEFRVDEALSRSDDSPGRSGPLARSTRRPRVRPTRRPDRC